MPGAELILAAKSDQTNILVGNPQISFFVAVYKRYTFFAIENIREPFVGNPKFGGKSFVTLGQYGDLINKIYLDIIIPALNPNNNPNYAASWINSIGHAIIKKIELEIGGIKIDEQYGLWMEIWSELTLTAEKKFAYYDMIGKHEYFNVTTQQGELHLRVPLQFWFCRNIGLSLPSIALQNQTIKIIITFTDRDDLWIASKASLNPLIEELGDTCNLNEYLVIKEAALYVDYIYLDEEERRWFVNTPHTYLIEQVQRNLISMNLTSIDNVVQLNFNHPVKEIIWVIRDKFFLVKVDGGGNEIFNFSTKPYFSGIKGTDPMIEANIYFEGKEFFKYYREAKYFREIQPYQKHTTVPDNFIYLYSFALFPEEYQPSGTCDFSKIDNAQLNIKLREGLSDPLIDVFAPCYNILNIKGGVSALKWA